MIKSNQIAIIGAGIAGLTTALCLAKHGFSVTIFEKASELQEVGAGLQLSPNATFILKKLNLLDQCLAKAEQPQYINLIDGYNLKYLSKLPIKKYTETHKLTPYLTIHRADLQNILLDAVKQFTSITLKLGQPILPAASDHIFIAADGIWSSSRHDKAVFSGYAAWRITIDKNDFKLAQQNDVYAYLGAKNHIIAYPICSGKKYNIVVITPHKILDKSWNISGIKSNLIPLFKNWNKDITNLLSNIENYTLWPLYTMPSIKFIEKNRILIGDASHGFLPFTAQGAGMAIEDAAELSFALFTYKNDIDYAINIYKDKRKNRLAKVKKRGDINSMIYHSSGITRIARNMILKHSNAMNLLNNLHWLYGYKI